MNRFPLCPDWLRPDTSGEIPMVGDTENKSAFRNSFWSTYRFEPKECYIGNRYLFTAQLGTSGQGFTRPLTKTETNVFVLGGPKTLYADELTWELFYPPAVTELEEFTRAGTAPNCMAESLFGCLPAARIGFKSIRASGQSRFISVGLPDGDPPWSTATYWKGSIPLKNASCVFVNLSEASRTWVVEFALSIYTAWRPSWPVHLRVTMAGVLAPEKE